MADAVVLKKVTKAFGETRAVHDLDLVVPQGALYGAIGPNGAGKTTTIRMILSILFPDRGDLEVLGRRSALEAKDRIGYLPEERGLYKKMRVADFLVYMARLKGMEGAGLPKQVETWLARVGLSDAARKRCEELSKGMQQKVGFVAAVIHRPDLLILDEPFSGLDPLNQRLLRDLVLEEHRRGATILFSTHIMLHAEQLCDHVVMIHRGEKVLDQPVRSIGSAFDPRSILFEPLDPAADVSVLTSVPGVGRVAREGGAWDVSLQDGAQPGAVLRAIVAAITPSRIEVRRPTLEDVFIGIVAAGEAAPPEASSRLRESLREGMLEEAGR
jgi:ABC-2 type transport system ATP-binding protein